MFLLLGFALHTQVAAAAEVPPIRTDLAVDIPITLGAGAIFVGLYLGSERQVTSHDLADRAPSGIDRWAPQEQHVGMEDWSNVLLYGSLGLGLATAVTGGWKRQPGSRVVLYFEALAIIGAITEITKYAVRRPRPYTYTEGIDEVDDTLSFFSGHTSFAACASFTSARAIDLTFDLTTPGRVALYSTAAIATSTVATLRVTGGKHFPSDVVVGAFVGTAVGLLVPELHRSERFRVGVAPRIGGAEISVSTNW